MVVAYEIRLSSAGTHPTALFSSIVTKLAKSMGFTASLKFDRVSGSTALTLSAVDEKIEEGQVVTSSVDGAIASGTTVASIAGNRLTLSQGTGVALASGSELTFTSATGLLVSLTAHPADLS